MLLLLLLLMLSCCDASVATAAAAPAAAAAAALTNASMPRRATPACPPPLLCQVMANNNEMILLPVNEPTVGTKRWVRGAVLPSAAALWAEPRLRHSMCDHLCACLLPACAPVQHRTPVRTFQWCRRHQPSRLLPSSQPTPSSHCRTHPPCCALQQEPDPDVPGAERGRGAAAHGPEDQRHCGHDEGDAGAVRALWRSCRWAGGNRRRALVLRLLSVAAAPALRAVHPLVLKPHRSRPHHASRSHLGGFDFMPPPSAGGRAARVQGRCCCRTLSPLWAGLTRGGCVRAGLLPQGLQVQHAASVAALRRPHSTPHPASPLPLPSPPPPTPDYYRKLPEEVGDKLTAQQYKAVEELGLLVDFDGQVGWGGAWWGATGVLARRAASLPACRRLCVSSRCVAAVRACESSVLQWLLTLQPYAPPAPRRACCCKSSPSRWGTAPQCSSKSSSACAASRTRQAQGSTACRRAEQATCIRETRRRPVRPAAA